MPRTGRLGWASAASSAASPISVKATRCSASSCRSDTAQEKPSTSGGAPRRWRRTPAARPTATRRSPSGPRPSRCCCSSASCVSLNSRTFSIAIAAWSAKVRSSAMCLSSKGCTSVRRTRIAPSARPSRSSGTASVVWWPCRRASSLPRGYSSCACCRSCTCTGWRSTMARPMTVLRSSGIGSPVGPPRSPKTATPRIVSPSRRMMSTNCASQILAARSATACSTGCTSVGEAEITCRISLVAVCRSSASCVSLNSRTFSIAITAWSANEVTSSISLSLNSLASWRPSVSTPMATPSRSIGTASSVR